MRPPPELLATNHPVLAALFHLAGALYVAGLLGAVLKRPAARLLVGGGVAAHLAATVGLGLVIEFFPLTNKFESFSAAALSLGIVAIATWRTTSRAYTVTLVVLLLACMATALSFPMKVGLPPPLMRTIWYPLHVPMSFFAYALWGAAGAGAVAWFFGRDPAWLARIDRFAMQGFGLWSLSMICGGVWGVVAWGAYFMWDPKILWSVILWFHYATFVHVRLTPSLRRWTAVRPVLALAGVLFVFIAYVGTSFFFGRSSHAF